MLGDDMGKDSLGVGGKDPEGRPFHQSVRPRIVVAGVMVGLALAGTFVASGVAGAAVQWKIVSSPDTSPSQNNILAGVSCDGPAECVAVGHSAGSNFQTLVESWNGSAWSIVSSPNPTSLPGAYGDSLHAVSCTSSTACVAVGADNAVSSHNVVTLIESWDGALRYRLAGLRIGARSRRVRGRRPGRPPR